MAPIVLVVEDDDLIRSMLVRFLEMAGIGVIEAENGLVALDRLTSARDDVTAILLDHDMPVMGGPEFRARHLADARIRDIPVIHMSAGDGWERYEGPPPHARMSKPLDIQRLVALIRSAGAPAGRKRAARRRSG